MSDKFSTQDRNLVIKELELIQKSKLSPVKPSRRLFKDDSGRYYYLFGGKDVWHGISYEQMKQLEGIHDKTLLVIAKKYRTRMDICVAAIDELVLNKDQLPTKNNRCSEE